MLAPLGLRIPVEASSRGSLPCDYKGATARLFMSLRGGVSPPKQSPPGGGDRSPASVAMTY